LQIPLTYSGIINQELGQLEVAAGRDASLDKVILEVVFKQLIPELAVEGPTIGHKGASLSHISNQPLLQALELICILDPSILVVPK